MAWSTPRTWTTGETVTQAHMNQEIRDNLNALFPNAITPANWQPSLEATTTNPSVSVTGAQYQIGASADLWARFEFSDIATPFGDGTYFVTLPETVTGISSSATAGSGQVVGTWQARDNSSGAGAHGNVLLRSATTVHFNTTATGLVDNDAPWIWAAFDVLSIFARVPIVAS